MNVIYVKGLIVNNVTYIFILFLQKKIISEENYFTINRLLNNMNLQEQINIQQMKKDFMFIQEIQIETIHL